MKKLVYFFLWSIGFALMSLGSGCSGDCVNIKILDAKVSQPSNVRIFFQVNQCDGSPVPGLSESAFVLKENGDAISVFESEPKIRPKLQDSRLLVLLLLDMSGSIVKAEGGIPAVQKAVETFLSKMPSEVEVGIHLFDGREETVVLSDFTKDRMKTKIALKTLTKWKVVDVSTNLNGAVKQSVNVLDRAISSSGATLSSSTLVIFTDGSDQAARLDSSSAGGAVNSSDSSVFSIGLGGEIKRGELELLGKSGFEFAENLDAISKAFDKVAQKIRDKANSFYILEYCSPKRKGSHELQLEVKKRGGLAKHQFDATGFTGGCKLCDSPQASCGGSCVDVQSSTSHCGKCGNVCRQDEACKEGKCMLSCKEGKAVCDGSCVDMKTSSKHCGQCGNACGKNAECKEGKCNCLPDKSDCSGSCVDVKTSSKHCGKCGNPCAGNQVCEGGKCKLPVGHECLSRAERKCYNGSGCVQTSEKWDCKGICALGSQECNSNGKWGACSGQTSPARELCDGKDNDCDGQVDNNFEESGRACTKPGKKGECARGSYTSCSGGTLNCTGTITPTKEVCDGKDNDCDGRVDNDICGDGEVCKKGHCVSTCIKAGTCVLVKAGSFTMGSPSSEPGRRTDEGPQHKVTLTRSYYMLKYEVTQKEFQVLMGYNPSKFNGCSKCPVEQINWHEAAAYANALSKKGGLAECFSCKGSGNNVTCQAVKHSLYLSCKGWRLPTEAEWEYAYRAGTTTALYNGSLTKPSGKDPGADKIAWYSGNSGSKTHEVGKKQANPWGLYDMGGNVWEWVYDWYSGYDSVGTTVADPVGPSTGSKRIDRGGGWGYIAKGVRAAHRGRDAPSLRSHNLGFRLVRSAP